MLAVALEVHGIQPKCMRPASIFRNYKIKGIKMEIDGQFYLCEGCGTYQPFMGNDVSCDCGHSNEFTDDEIIKMEEAAEEGY